MTTKTTKKSTRVRDLIIDNTRLNFEMSVAWKALALIAASQEPKSVVIAKSALERLPKFEPAMFTKETIQ